MTTRLLGQIDVGVVTADALGDVSFANRAARELVGVDADAQLACPAHVLLGLPFDGFALLGERVRWTAEVALHGRELEISVKRVSSSEPGVVLLYTLRDVSHERTLQAEMQRVARLAAIGTMVAGFAHEVRNPVASLRSLAESVDEELRDRGVQLAHPARMLEVLARIERLVSTSLQFGRPATPHRALHHPERLAREAVTRLDAPVRVDIEAALPAVSIDEGQLVQVLVILLTNALEAARSPHGVLLRVVATGDASSVRFEVLDDGPGIPPEVRDRIFDPFFTTKPTGVGLGLSIAQQLVAENGARLDVSREVPTVFTVTCAAANPTRAAADCSTSSSASTRRIRSDNR